MANMNTNRLCKIHRTGSSLKSKGVAKATTQSAYRIRQSLQQQDTLDKGLASKKRAKVSCTALILEVRGQISEDNSKAAIMKID